MERSRLFSVIVFCSEKIVQIYSVFLIHQKTNEKGIVFLGFYQFTNMIFLLYLSKVQKTFSPAGTDRYPAVKEGAIVCFFSDGCGRI